MRGSISYWGNFHPTASNEHRAVACLLSSGALARKFKAESHVTEEGHIDFPTLLADCYSSSERLLALVAWQLWNGGGPDARGPGLRELVITLDDEQFEAAIEAMRLHRSRR